MSINKILDTAVSNPSNKIRVWDLVVDNSATLPTGSTQPSDIAPGTNGQILVTSSGTSSWSNAITPQTITFNNSLVSSQAALSCYTETANIALNWTGPSISGSVFAKYVRIGSLVFMSIQSSFGGNTTANGTWTVSGIPVNYRPVSQQTVPMSFAYTEITAPNTFKAQAMMVVNTDGTGIPFGSQGTQATGGNTVSYSVQAGTISWSLI